MPWKPSDAPQHTKKADTEKEKEAWARIANMILRKTGDEGKAIRIANAAVKKTGAGRK